jgi:molybdate/tungstate transport system permease protein
VKPSTAKISPFQLVLILLSGIVLLFILGPLLGMIFHSSFQELAETGRDNEVVRSIGLTLWISMAATLLTAIAAIPFAYVLARRDFPLKRLVNGIVDLPIVIPHSAAGIAILGVISRDTVVGQLGSALGLNFVGAPAGIAIAMAFVSVPFLVNAARDGFAAVPVRYEQAAATLGASPARIFFTISLPLAWRNIVSGLVLMFGRGMSEFGAVVIIAYHPMIAPVMIWDRFSSFGLQYARPVAILFIMISLVVFIALRILGRRSENA